MIHKRLTLDGVFKGYGLMFRQQKYSSVAPSYSPVLEVLMTKGPLTEK